MARRVISFRVLRGFVPEPTLLLVLALGLGEGGPHGPIGNSFIEALALIILVRLPFRDWRDQGLAAMTAAWLVLVLLLTGFVQLIPLPASIWTQLPGREVLADTLAGLGRRGSPWPLSLSPNDTRSVLISWMPAVAIFFSTCRLQMQDRTRLVWLVVGMGVVSAFVGFAQMAEGDGSFFPYGLPPFTRFPGLFSNFNHQATLLAACLILLAGAAMQGRPLRATIVTSVIAVVLVLATLITGSRAGLALLLMAATCASAIHRIGRRTRAAGAGRLRSRPGPFRSQMVVVPAAIVLGMVILIGSYRWNLMHERFSGLAEDARFSFWRSTFDAIRHYFPVGSGLGTFDIVYEANEPLELVESWTVNHAHNDYLEFTLEAGLPGVVLMALAFAWWLWCLIASFRRSQKGSGEVLGLAGAAVVLMIMLHSIVDYPLRTQAIGCLLGFASALLVPVRGLCDPISVTEVELG